MSKREGETEMQTTITPAQRQAIEDWNVERKLRADGLASVIHHLGAALDAAPAGSSSSVHSSIEHVLNGVRGNLRAVLNESNPFI
jgi:hypothetical protein